MRTRCSRGRGAGAASRARMTWRKWMSADGLGRAGDRWGMRIENGRWRRGVVEGGRVEVEDGVREGGDARSAAPPVAGAPRTRRARGAAARGGGESHHRVGLLQCWLSAAGREGEGGSGIREREDRATAPSHSVISLAGRSCATGRGVLTSNRNRQSRRRSARPEDRGQGVTRLEDD